MTVLIFALWNYVLYILDKRPLLDVFIIYNLCSMHWPFNILTMPSDKCKFSNFSVVGSSFLQISTSIPYLRISAYYQAMKIYFMLFNTFLKFNSFAFYICEQSTWNWFLCKLGSRGQDALFFPRGSQLKQYKNNKFYIIHWSVTFVISGGGVFSWMMDHIILPIVIEGIQFSLSKSIWGITIFLNFTLVTLICLYWYLIVILICISLVDNYANSTSWAYFPSV